MTGPVPGVVAAGPGRRLLAALVDLAVGAAPAALVAASEAGPVRTGAAVLVVVVALTQWVLQARLGWTLGKRLTGLRTLGAATGRPVGLGRTALRLLVLGLGSVLTAASILFDRSGRGRGWHDLAAGTAVLDVVRGTDPSAAPVVTASSAGARIDTLLAGAPPAPAATAPGGPPAPRHAAPPPVALPPVPARPPEPRPPSVPVPPPVPAGGPAPGVRPEPGAVAVRTDAPRPAEPAEPFELPEELERTRLSSARRREVPARDPGNRVTLWDGRCLEVTGTILVGRNPAPREGEPAPSGTLEVADPGRSVSKTHLLVGVDPHGLWIQDRDSTNGTVVTLADGQQILCAADQTVRVPVGASVAFGDFWFTVTP